MKLAEDRAKSEPESSLAKEFTMLKKLIENGRAAGEKEAE